MLECDVKRLELLVELAVKGLRGPEQGAKNQNQNSNLWLLLQTQN